MLPVSIRFFLFSGTTFLNLHAVRAEAFFSSGSALANGEALRWEIIVMVAWSKSPTGVSGIHKENITLSIQSVLNFFCTGICSKNYLLDI
jgi:hypothetical protein